MNTCKHTYAASQRRKPFDWNAFLAPDTVYNPRQLNAACKRSGEWVTCACGVQCSVIPRYVSSDLWGHSSGEPKDEALSTLGYRFHREVNWLRDAYDGVGTTTVASARAAARSTLTQIERRARVLIRQVEAQS